MGFVATVKWILIALAIIYGIFIIINGYLKAKKITSKRIYSDYHVHSKFCDGHDEIEDIVDVAIEKNMPKIGFSSHSYLPSEMGWPMTKEGTEEYKKVVTELKGKYKNQIEILLGVEQDYWSPTDDLSDYDYVIGSVHSILEQDTKNSAVDGLTKSFEYAAENYFDGDKMAAAERYFELVSDLYDRTHCDVIGHFDLITKYNEKCMKEEGKPFVDSDDPRFVEAERKALEKLVATPVIFEINTGGMARGYRTSPYPSERVLKFLSEHNTPVILGSDSHEKENLCYGFDEVMELVKKYNLNLVYDPRNK
ncbi:MAG: histidinol-phosphatase [Oscillospiraceae bacterium]|nr:histidinol-phosphatase [Candidatus Limimonas coprohippi]